MNTRTALILILLAPFFFCTAASAQQIYRCGKTYSQIPCPGAVIVNARDDRNKAQQRQSQKDTVRDTQLAADLEETRKQEEAMAAAGGTPLEQRSKPKSNKSTKAKTSKNKQMTEGGADDEKTPSKKTKKGSEFFTAKTLGDKK